MDLDNFRTEMELNTDQNSATTDFEKSVTERFKLLSYRCVKDEVNIGVNKFMPTTQHNKQQISHLNHDKMIKMHRIFQVRCT